MKKRRFFTQKNAAFRSEKVTILTLQNVIFFYPKNDDFFSRKNKKSPEKIRGIFD
jgi:hypothetical protein